MVFCRNFWYNNIGDSMKKRIKVKPILILLLLIVTIIIFVVYINKNKDLIMVDLSTYTIEEIKEYAKEYGLSLTISEEYSDLDKNVVIKQNIKPGEVIKNKTLVVTISNGTSYKELYTSLKVNELGLVPVMMYHGIHNVKSDDTAYTGGNVDVDGYQRTAEAFRKDLDLYYESGYRMIRLEDYVKGIIDVELGKSPIVLTFDDGLKNNINVLGLDEDDNIIIDPNSAVGILESYKKEYPDFNVTATFFVNGGLFQQSEYNEKILKWLVNNGYDIGNHTYNHYNLKNIDELKVQKDVATLYQKLDNIIPNEYVNIVALPFGSPFSESHTNFKYIIDGKYQDYSYHTISTLKVGSTSNYSPFDKNYNSKFINRIRAYDNNGLNFDIEMNFNSLEKNRYISDGNKDKVVIPESSKLNLNESITNVTTY